MVPDEQDREVVHKIIYEKLVLGGIRDDTKKAYLEIIDRSVNAHQIQGVILGCTGISLLIRQADLGIPVFDTTRIHAEIAVDFALKGN